MLPETFLGTSFFPMGETTDQLFQYQFSGHQHLVLHKGGEMFLPATYGVPNNGCFKFDYYNNPALESTGRCFAR